MQTDEGAPARAADDSTAPEASVAAGGGAPAAAAALGPSGGDNQQQQLWTLRAEHIMEAADSLRKMQAEAAAQQERPALRDLAVDQYEKQLLSEVGGKLRCAVGGVLRCGCAERALGCIGAKCGVGTVWAASKGAAAKTVAPILGVQGLPIRRGRWLGQQFA